MTKEGQREIPQATKELFAEQSKRRSLLHELTEADPQLLEESAERFVTALIDITISNIHKNIEDIAKEVQKHRSYMPKFNTQLKTLIADVKMKWSS